MYRMNIEYLRAFTKLAISNNYTKTAADLFISQPALTKQIKSLEQQLGVELFERTSRSVALSPMGREFLPYAQRILAEYDAAINHIADYHSKSINQISLGTHMFFPIWDLRICCPLSMRFFPASWSWPRRAFLPAPLWCRSWQTGPWMLLFSRTLPRTFPPIGSRYFPFEWRKLY